MPRKPTDIRFLAWLSCLVVAGIGCVGWASVPGLGSSPLLRAGLFSSLGLSMLGLVFFFPKCPPRTATSLIVFPAILLRLLLWPAPVSDDVNRYLWEGLVVMDGANPYSAPADNEAWSDRRDVIWEGMNHRDRPTAYPPGIMWIMAGTAAIHPALVSFKVLALIGDLLSLFVLLKLLEARVAPIRWAGFYAFNPVVLIAFAAEGHFDSLMIAAMLAALLSASREKWTVWLWLGIAVQVKLVCLVLIPLFLTRKLLHSSFVLPLVLLLPSLPFVAALPDWLDGVLTFAGGGAFNGPAFTLLSVIGLPSEFVRPGLSACFLMSAFVICLFRWRGSGLVDSCLWMLSLLLAFSPIVHFWYVAWLLPLAALKPSFAWSVVSVTMGGYFIAWWTLANSGWWGFGHGIAAIIWIPWALAGAAQNRFAVTKLAAHRKRERNANIGARPQPPTLSIVIPVLKPDPPLLLLLNALRQATGVAPEIIIVSSEEKSFELPEKLVTAPRGRGNQIAAGISATSGDWILIVHSDSTPRTDFATVLKKAISVHSQASLLVFGQRFDKQSPGTLLIEALNELRVVFGGVAFGDQTMLIRRSALESAGGFPAQPLMEDVEVSMRLATRGDVIYLGREWILSAVKWQRKYTSRFRLVIRLVATYQLARFRSRAHAAEVSKRMYREYYG